MYTYLPLLSPIVSAPFFPFFDFSLLLLLHLTTSHLAIMTLVCVRAHLRPGTYHVLVLTELQRICGTGAQGDGSLLNAFSRKCYMHTLQYVHRSALP